MRLINSFSFDKTKAAVGLAAKWLQENLGIPASAADVDVAGEDRDSAEARGRRTVTLLIAPSHDNMCLWIALASMGYTTQFISPAHVPEVIASLIARAQSRGVVYSGLDASWVDESRTTRSDMAGTSASFSYEAPKWRQAPVEVSMNGLLARVRSGERQDDAIADDAPRPLPFVVLHSFGSTATPKLYPLHLSSADLSAKDAATWWIKTPSQARWRCQLQTSLPFHFSFQNPVWRQLMCGTTLAFPVIRANADDVANAQSKGGVTLVPGAPDVLDSLSLAKADVLYASPTGLENMVLTAVNGDNPAWKDALQNLKEAHSGGAPTSFQVAETFSKNGLMVMQVFATTEAGMLFVGKPSLTGHLCHLTPRPQLKDKMLFYQPDKANDTLELWLPEDFPGLQKAGLKFEPFPEDPTTMAWNTSDTFARIPGSTDAAPLYLFRGRTDDWLRLTSGTACRALEIESRLAQLLREKAESRSPSLASSSRFNSRFNSAMTSPVLTTGQRSVSSGSTSPDEETLSERESRSTGLSTDSVSQRKNSISPATSDSSHGFNNAFKRIQHVAALGNARKSLGAVVQLDGFAEPTDEEREAARQAAEIVTREQLQYPAVLKPEAVVFATADRPLNVTQKGSMQRKKNEALYAPLFADLGIF